MEAPASISLVDRIRSLLRETLLSTANTTKDEAKQIVSNMLTIFWLRIRINPNDVTDQVGNIRHCGTKTVAEGNVVKISSVLQFNLLLLKVEIVDSGLGISVLLDPKHAAECFQDMVALQEVLDREEPSLPQSAQRKSANDIDEATAVQETMGLPNVQPTELSGSNTLERFDSLMNLKYARLIKRLGIASVDHKRFEKIHETEENRKVAHLNRQYGPSLSPSSNQIRASTPSSSTDNGPLPNLHLFGSAQQANNPTPANRLPLSQSLPLSTSTRQKLSCNLFDKHFPI